MSDIPATPPLQGQAAPSKDSHKGLWFMAIAGAFLILVFGFGADWINGHVSIVSFVHVPQLSHAEWWEVGALIWSLLFALYYYFTFESMNNHLGDRALGFAIAFGTVALCVVAAYYIHTNSLRHLWFVVLIGVLFLIADVILYYQLKKQYQLKEQPDDQKKHKKYHESLLVADAPMIVGLLVVLAFQMLHGNCPEITGVIQDSNVKEMQMQMFLGGAISFQLIVSNVIFLLSQFGVFRNIWLR